MQFVSCTGKIPLLEPIARQGQLVKPGFAFNLPNFMDECVTRLDQRGTITFIVPAVPSMFEEHIDLEIMLSPKVIRTKVKTTKT